MADFESAVNFVLTREGGLEENSCDPGGITNFGISLRFLKNIEVSKLKEYEIFDLEVTEDTIRNLTIPQAKNIYRGEFWNHAPFEEIVFQEVANYIFDMAVNMGIASAIKCVQRATWAVLKKWENLKDDGILGLKTLSAITLSGFMLIVALRAERGAYYRSLGNKEFLNGWYNRTYK